MIDLGKSMICLHCKKQLCMCKQRDRKGRWIDEKYEDKIISRDKVRLIGAMIAIFGIGLVIGSWDIIPTFVAIIIMWIGVGLTWYKK